MFQLLVLVAKNSHISWLLLYLFGPVPQSYLRVCLPDLSPQHVYHIKHGCAWFFQLTRYTITPKCGAVPLQFSVSWKRVSAHFRLTHPVCLVIPIMLTDHVSLDPPCDLFSSPPSAEDRQTCHCRDWWQGILLHGRACEPAWLWLQSPPRWLTPWNTLGHGHTDASTHSQPSLPSLLSLSSVWEGKPAHSSALSLAPNFKWGQGGKNTLCKRRPSGSCSL